MWLLIINVAFVLISPDLSADDSVGLTSVLSTGVVDHFLVISSLSHQSLVLFFLILSCELQLFDITSDLLDVDLEVVKSFDVSFDVLNITRKLFRVRFKV